MVIKRAPSFDPLFAVHSRSSEQPSLHESSNEYGPKRLNCRCFSTIPCGIQYYNKRFPSGQRNETEIRSFYTMATTKQVLKQRKSL
jgi:hypothetical protein